MKVSIFTFSENEGRWTTKKLSTAVDDAKAFILKLSCNGEQEQQQRKDKQIRVYYRSKNILFTQDLLWHALRFLVVKKE